MVIRVENKEFKPKSKTKSVDKSEALGVPLNQAAVVAVTEEVVAQVRTPRFGSRGPRKSFRQEGPQEFVEKVVTVNRVAKVV